MRWVWLGWLLTIAVTFAIFEGYALSHADGLSLSQFTVDALTAWPPLHVLIGIGIGILITHFSWHWVPKQKREICGRCGATILKP